jgi:hypothetical protein
VGVGSLAWWGKNKIQEMAGSAAGTVEQIAELEKKANQNPFTRPADGVVSEERLLKFIEVRKRVFAVYEKNRTFFDQAAGRKQADLSDITKGVSILGEVRTAQAQALADLGMNTEEYTFLVESIYKSAWASEFEKGQGKSASEAMGEAAAQVQKQLESAGSPEAAKAIADAKAAAEQSKALEVPKANIELFRKHEAEIRKYAMAGLELVGL